MTYAKLFSSLLTSTIWAEDSDTRVLWITMLVLANRDGVVEGSVPGLAHQARLSREACERALKVLQSPDPDSRTREHEGRRIVAIKGGWSIYNYESYRDRASAEEQRQLAAARQMRFRERQARAAVSNAPSVTCNDRNAPSTASNDENASCSCSDQGEKAAAARAAEVSRSVGRIARKLKP